MARSGDSSPIPSTVPGKPWGRWQCQAGPQPLQGGGATPPSLAAPSPKEPGSEVGAVGGLDGAGIFVQPRFPGKQEPPGAGRRQDPRVGIKPQCDPTTGEDMSPRLQPPTFPSIRECTGIGMGARARCCRQTQALVQQDPARACRPRCPSHTATSELFPEDEEELPVGAGGKRVPPKGLFFPVPWSPWEPSTKHRGSLAA